MVDKFASTKSPDVLIFILQVFINFFDGVFYLQNLCFMHYFQGMSVKLLDLVEQNAEFKGAFLKKFEEILDSGQFILGEEVELFEKNMAQYLSCKYALGVSSGTDALLVALMALNIKPGDEVICPAYTFFATAGCVSRLGAKPVFVDVNYDDFCISVDDLKNKITKNTKAVIGVHLFGQACDCDTIADICSDHGIFFIEDCAQALGAKRNNKMVGTFGTVGCFSFFPSKNLGGFGDSGLVCTNDESLYENMKILRMHGMKPQYFHKKIGGNFRIDALQAALLNIKLPKVDTYIEKRRKNADFYRENLQGLSDHIVLPSESKNNFHTWNQYTIRVLNGKRDALKNYLQSNGIGCAIYYPVPLNKQECFMPQIKEFQISEKLSSRALSLPIYPELIPQSLKTVVETVYKFFNF